MSNTYYWSHMMFAMTLYTNIFFYDHVVIPFYFSESFR